MVKHFKIVLWLSIITCSSVIFAQQQAANWYFGEEAGVSFSSGFPNQLSDGVIDTAEGCSTISNKQGNLLFYTDGTTVWNKNHNIMINGTGLTGDDSSTQSAIIIPKPDSETIFYIFTVDDRAGAGGLRFSEVDITLDNGLGAITTNKNILLEASITEKITAVESSDGLSIWVISHRWNSNEFVAYLVTDVGVNTTPVVSATGSIHTGLINNTIGYLKASPNREKIASVRSYVDNQTEIFDFNATTGILSNPISIANYSSSTIGPYGCEFSPDSRLLYVTEINYETEISLLHQYDLTLSTAAQIINSDVIITQQDGRLGAIQQALDGKLYVAKFGSHFLNVIKNPNEIGLNCNYEQDSFSLGTKISQFGLPPFIQSYFFATNIFNNTCFGDSTTFLIDTSTVIDSITWDFGDPASGVNNTSNSLNPTHVYSSSGNFNVTISIDTQGETQLIYRTVFIADKPPVLDLGILTTCETENANAEFDLTSNVPAAILSNPDYFLSFYETLLDAENSENDIVSPNNYTSVNGNQIIYLRIDTPNGDCYSISEIELSIINKPVIEPLEEIFFCDDNTNSTTIDVGNLQYPNSQYNFLWLESNETTPQIQVDNAGTYIVRITDISTISFENPEGCFAERTVIVETSSIADITNIEVTNSTAVTFNTGIGDYEYALDNINGIYQNSNVFTNISPGVHTIFVRDKNGCGVVEKQFSVIDFPEYFTPNGDTINDYWQVYGISRKFQNSALIYIFDRYGKLITQLKTDSPGWDGTLNGKPLPQSDYWFSVKLDDGRAFKGHFTLKR
ncbi:T9SS type B sorting domain-containing protein [Lacinutrix chionoecetis]